MSNYAKYQISFKLLLKRGEEFLILKDNDNLWDLPGGRADATETRLPTSEIISREIEEELGKDFKYQLKSPITQFTRHISEQNEPVMIIVFEADYISGDIGLSKEHGSYEWINPLKTKLTKKEFFNDEEYLFFLKYFEEQLRNNNSLNKKINVCWQDNEANRHLKSINDRTLFIYSPHFLPQLGALTQLPKLSINSEEIGINKKKIDNLIKTINLDFERIVAIGGGRTLDLAKYIAHHSCRELTLIPPIISTNAFFTDKVILKEKDGVRTFQGKFADHLILDENLLTSSDFQWNLYGLADVLSFHTALRDWKISAEKTGEKMVFEIYSLGDILLKNLINNAQSIVRPNKKNISAIIRLVALAGYSVNLHGNGRPESGSEHIFAQCLESKMRIPHGVAVSLGIALMSILQKNESVEIINTVKRLKLLTGLNEYGLTKEILLETLLSLIPRPDRYTILNEIKIDPVIAREMIEDIQKKYGFKLN